MQAFLNCKLGQAVYIVKQHFVTLYLRTNSYFIAIPQKKKKTHYFTETKKNLLFPFIMNIRERIHVEREEEISFIFLTHDNNIQNYNTASLKITEISKPYTKSNSRLKNCSKYMPIISLRNAQAVV